jgi:hypothetical protein
MNMCSLFNDAIKNSTLYGIEWFYREKWTRNDVDRSGLDLIKDIIPKSDWRDSNHKAPHAGQSVPR